MTPGIHKGLYVSHSRWDSNIIVYVFADVCPDIGTPDGIAFDWINKRIYYSDYSNQTINSMAEDGSNRTIIARVPKPRAIVLDPCRGYAMVFVCLYPCFWSEWSLKSFMLIGNQQIMDLHKIQR